MFVHSLADTYSHEACTKVASFQGHEMEPEECNAGEWHGQYKTLSDGQQVFETDEFGEGAEGLPYTSGAAWAVWSVLKGYRETNLDDPGVPLWTDEEVGAFIDGWVVLSQPGRRQGDAVRAFDGLNESLGADCGVASR